MCLWSREGCVTVLYQSSDARTGTLVTGYMPVEIESELSLQGIAETTVGSDGCLLGADTCRFKERAVNK